MTLNPRASPARPSSARDQTHDGECPPDRSREKPYTPWIRSPAAQRFTTSRGAAAAPKVSDSEVRLARALVRSFERDHQLPGQQIIAIAALPLPVDECGAG